MFPSYIKLYYNFIQVKFGFFYFSFRETVKSPAFDKLVGNVDGTVKPLRFHRGLITDVDTLEGDIVGAVLAGLIGFVLNVHNINLEELALLWYTLTYSAE